MAIVPALSKHRFIIFEFEPHTGCLVMKAGSRIEEVEDTSRVKIQTYSHDAEERATDAGASTAFIEHVEGMEGRPVVLATINKPDHPVLVHLDRSGLFLRALVEGAGDGFAALTEAKMVLAAIDGIEGLAVPKPGAKGRDARGGLLSAAIALFRSKYADAPAQSSSSSASSSSSSSASSASSSSSSLSSSSSSSSSAAGLDGSGGGDGEESGGDEPEDDSGPVDVNAVDKAEMYGDVEEAEAHEEDEGAAAADEQGDDEDNIVPNRRRRSGKEFPAVRAVAGSKRKAAHNNTSGASESSNTGSSGSGSGSAGDEDDEDEVDEGAASSAGGDAKRRRLVEEGEKIIEAAKAKAQRVAAESARALQQSLARQREAEDAATAAEARAAAAVAASAAAARAASDDSGRSSSSSSSNEALQAVIDALKKDLETYKLKADSAAAAGASDADDKEAALAKLRMQVAALKKQLAASANEGDKVQAAASSSSSSAGGTTEEAEAGAGAISVYTAQAACALLGEKYREPASFKYVWTDQDFRSLTLEPEDEEQQGTQEFARVEERYCLTCRQTLKHVCGMIQFLDSPVGAQLVSNSHAHELAYQQLVAIGQACLDAHQPKKFSDPDRYGLMAVVVEPSPANGFEVATLVIQQSRIKQDPAAVAKKLAEGSRKQKRKQKQSSSGSAASSSSNAVDAGTDSTPATKASMAPLGSLEAE